MRARRLGRVRARSHEQEAQVVPRPEVCESAPGVEEDVQALAADLDAPVPGDDACAGRKAELRPRLRLVRGPPAREVERVRDLADPLGRDAVARANALDLERRADHESRRSANGGRSDSPLERRQLEVASLKGSERGEPEHPAEQDGRVEARRLVLLAEQGRAAQAADLARQRAKRRGEIGGGFPGHDSRHETAAADGPERVVARPGVRVAQPPPRGPVRAGRRQERDHRSRLPVPVTLGPAHVAREADDRRVDPGEAQCLHVAEEPAAGHLVAKLREGEIDRVEEVLDHVPPGEERDPPRGAQRSGLRHAAAVSVPGV